jgi:hypothetical protein
MRNSSNQNIVFGLLTAAVLLFICLFAFQGVLPEIVDYLVNYEQPIGSTAPPMEAGLAPIRVGNRVGDLVITVTAMRRPADEYVLSANPSAVLSDVEEYILVSMKIQCVSLNGCQLNETDFGIQSASNMGGYPPQHASNYPELDVLIEGGAIGAEKMISGGMIFIVAKTDETLLLFYPRSNEMSARARFILE